MTHSQPDTRPDPVAESAPGTGSEPDTVDTVVRTAALVLQRDDVTPASNFLELGGTSLAAIHLVEKLNREFGAELTPLAPFDTEDMRGLAELYRTSAAS